MSRRRDRSLLSASATVTNASTKSRWRTWPWPERTASASNAALGAGVALVTICLLLVGKQERRVRLAELVRAGKASSGLKECQQVGVELLLVRVREAVGCALVDLQGRVLDQLR